MNHPIHGTLQLSVWLRIQKYKKQGGPTEDDYARARAFALILAEKADILLFGGGKNNEVAKLFNNLADAVAVMAFAFVPGGVTVFGEKYEEKT